MHKWSFFSWKEAASCDELDEYSYFYSSNYDGAFWENCIELVRSLNKNGVVSMEVESVFLNIWALAKFSRVVLSFCSRLQFTSWSGKKLQTPFAEALKIWSGNCVIHILSAKLQKSESVYFWSFITNWFWNEEKLGKIPPFKQTEKSTLGQKISLGGQSNQVEIQCNDFQLNQLRNRLPVYT